MPLTLHVVYNWKFTSPNNICVCCSYYLRVLKERVVHFQDAPNTLMRPINGENYITQKSSRPATSWLPPIWECFPFKQTRSCRRWRRVSRGVKQTGVLNESVEAGEFSAVGLWFSYTQVLNTGSGVCLKAHGRYRGSWCSFAFRAGCAFLRYRDKTNHLTSVCLLWDICCNIISS